MWCTLKLSKVPLLLCFRSLGLLKHQRMSESVDRDTRKPLLVSFLRIIKLVQAQICVYRLLIQQAMERSCERT